MIPTRSYEGDTIADAAISDALAEPHDEHRTGGKDYCQEGYSPSAHVGTAGAALTWTWRFTRYAGP